MEGEWVYVLEAANGVIGIRTWDVHVRYGPDAFWAIGVMGWSAVVDGC